MFSPKTGANPEGPDFETIVRVGLLKGAAITRLNKRDEITQKKPA